MLTFKLFFTLRQHRNNCIQITLVNQHMLMSTVKYIEYYFNFDGVPIFYLWNSSLLENFFFLRICMAIVLNSVVSTFIRIYFKLMVTKLYTTFVYFVLF